jgi:hypothetical protein
MTHAEVKVFFSEEARRFGFVFVEGKEVFFHLGDHAAPVISGDKLSLGFREKTSRAPKTGDLLAIDAVVDGKKGPRVQSWAFLEEVEPLEKLLHKAPWGPPDLLEFGSAWSSGKWATPFLGDVHKGATHVSYDRGFLVEKYGKQVGYPTYYSRELKGIIPPEAEDGYWYWDGTRWVHPETVIIRPEAAIVIEGETSRSTECQYRYIGLCYEGELLPSMRYVDKLAPRNPINGGTVTSLNFWSGRKEEIPATYKDLREVTIPVVTVVVEEYNWKYIFQLTDPTGIVAGFAPSFLVAVAGKAAITKKYRVRQSSVHEVRVELATAMEEPVKVQMELPRDEYYLDEWDESHPHSRSAHFITREDDKVFEGSIFYDRPRDKGLEEFVDSVDKAPWTIGPVGEPTNREEGVTSPVEWLR